MKPTRSLHIAWLMLASLLNFASLSAQNYTDFVDPRIGTGDHGHVFAGANVPFGMVNAGPTQIKSGWDWCSGYHESCDTIVGFAQTHLSGTGCSDLGDIALMPTQGNVELTREGIASKYSHARETLRPGYYQVMLERFGINTEITATRRTALYRFTYPKQGDERLIVDLQNGVGDRMMSGNLTRLNDTTFVGYRISHGWADVQHAYFAFIVNRPALKDVRKKGQIHELKFAPKGNEPLMLRIALSPTSELNALMNLRAEGTAMWNFEQESKQADAAWNEELGRIDAKFAKEKDKRIFYTAMYHFMVAPQTWDDVNGDWRGADNLTYRADATYRNSIPSVARRKAGGNSYLT
ncbi:MAG: glycoside hydrolase family 92 protein, partial [Bacteroidaceae bacterium]|nr:glycoside hydrolase family 92 protein [Bacteroidaceae bacterium]